MSARHVELNVGPASAVLLGFEGLDTVLVFAIVQKVAVVYGLVYGRVRLSYKGRS